MEKYLAILQKNNLFAEMDCEQILSILLCLQAKKEKVRKGQVLFIAGDSVRRLGIVLSGTVHVIREDSLGLRILLAPIHAGDFFAEALCCAQIQESPISAVCAENGEVLWIDFQRIITMCSNACIFHTVLISNMLRVLAEKNMFLQQRLEIVSKKKIRERILMYLNLQAEKYGKQFSIPMNREELADFLCVDRSALSRELSNLQKEKILSFKKNYFIFSNHPIKENPRNRII